MEPFQPLQKVTALPLPASEPNLLSTIIRLFVKLSALARLPLPIYNYSVRQTLLKITVIEAVAAMVVIPLRSDIAVYKCASYSL
jgi:hypothetical protein